MHHVLQAEQRKSKNKTFKKKENRKSRKDRKANKDEALCAHMCVCVLACERGGKINNMCKIS